MSDRRYKAGFYRARGVAGTEQHGYAQGGGEQVSLELDVQISDQNVVRLTTILAFAGGAGPISIERLKALGWDGSNELRGIDRNEVEVEIKYEIPPGKTEEQMRVEIKTGGRFAFKKPMNDQEKRGFMAALSKQAAQLDAANGQRPPAQANERGAEFPYGANAPPQGAPQSQGQAPPGQAPYRL